MYVCLCLASLSVCNISSFFDVVVVVIALLLSYFPLAIFSCLLSWRGSPYVCASSLYRWNRTILYIYLHRTRFVGISNEFHNCMKYTVKSLFSRSFLFGINVLASWHHFLFYSSRLIQIFISLFPYRMDTLSKLFSYICIISSQRHVLEFCELTVFVAFSLCLNLWSFSMSRALTHTVFAHDPATALEQNPGDVTSIPRADRKI